MLRGIFHIFLAISILASSMGFTVYERLCNMRGHQITLSADHDKCCAHHKPKVEQPKLSCCKAKHKPAPVKVDQSNCCSHNAIFMQAHAGAPLSTAKITLDGQLLALALLPALSLDFPFPIEEAPADYNSIPIDPPDGKSIRVRFQSFRC